ncbi:hypothetical protein BUALT_Bualt01G0029300 [Buddleja alternifolia]|uniref:WAT1-related protein n=1 Tax=Buddleja alternifolia TaxID=168488 RepID=A0AAV6YA10_9LAMI|nr:hypothetical protein BUALT_Bualt01G0029300 [Buddleja alternifolia]
MEGNFLPFFIMAMLQLGFAVMNITSKLALDSGMHPFVFVAYRQIFASVAIAPFAYFFERVTLNQFSYFVGLKNSSPTIGCALANISPAVTFILAALFRVAGSVLIVSGLYGVLWGKGREMIEKATQTTFCDLESHSKSSVNTSDHATS